jgi:hypothetical protein
MARYFISTKHTQEQCLQALDEELAKGPDILDKFVYGCKEGDHTGYAIVDVNSKSDALAMIPDFLQDSACIARVDRVTPSDIKMFHQKAA